MQRQHTNYSFLLSFLLSLSLTLSNLSQRAAHRLTLKIRLATYSHHTPHNIRHIILEACRIINFADNLITVNLTQAYMHILKWSNWCGWIHTSSSHLLAIFFYRSLSLSICVLCIVNSKLKLKCMPHLLLDMFITKALQYD